MFFFIYILYLNLFFSFILFKWYYIIIWLKIINYFFWLWIINIKKRDFVYNIFNYLFKKINFVF